MRHLRLLVLASILALPLSLVAPAPALAAEVVTTLPGDWEASLTTCVGDNGAGTVSTELGPDTPPLGTGSLELLAPGSEQTYVGHDVGPLSNLQSWDLGLRRESGIVPLVAIVLLENQHQLVAQPSLDADSWTMVDAYALDYEIYSFAGDDLGPTTIPEYLSTNPDDSALLVVVASACFGGAGGALNVDDYGWTSNGTFTSYDFEAGLETTAAISASRSTITAGGSTTLGTRLMQDGSAVPGADVDLFAKPAGSDSFSKVDTVTTGDDGRASLKVKPMKNTAYQWRYSVSAQSATKTVKVRAKVTLALADSSLRTGQKLVATGKVTPAKGGFKATLWRLTGSGKDKLATTLIAADGDYKLTKSVTKAGTWKVFVTVPAADGNEAGTSPVRKASVS